MEIGTRHWFSVLSIAVVAHLYAAVNVNLTGFTAESKDPFDRYTVDLTTLALPPKQLKLEPFKPAPPKETPVPEAKPEPQPKPKPKPKPKPVPKPVKPKIVAPKIEKPKVVRPELEKPVQATQPVETQPNEAQQPAPPVQQPARTSTAKPSASHRPAPRPGSRNGKPKYYQLILERLERLKKYPSRARRRGQQGTVVLAFTLNRDGSLKHYRITQSSGTKSLDLEVKKLIIRATPFPAIPKNISSDTLEVSVPITFSLQ